MKRKKRPIWLLVLSSLLLASLVYLVLNFPPTHKFTIYNLSFDPWLRTKGQFTILPLFFILLFSTLYSLFTALLSNKRRGLLIALFFSIYLILRLINLTHPFFLILLIALFGGIEIFFVKRK